VKVTAPAADRTAMVAAAVGSMLRVGDVVVLSGELGAGKTTFAKGLARGLGVTETVTSPTFTIVQQYEGRVPVAHVDVYRLDRMQELHDLGFEELLESSVTLVEWGEAIAPVLPRDRLVVHLAPVDDDPNARTIEIHAHGATWASRQRQLDDALAAVGNA
jgi:tRNA threonylcarbamoyladenosine biosynthesis protein TsaE